MKYWNKKKLQKRTIFLTCSKLCEYAKKITFLKVRKFWKYIFLPIFFRCSNKICDLYFNPGLDCWNSYPGAMNFSKNCEFLVKTAQKTFIFPPVLNISIAKEQIKALWMTRNCQYRLQGNGLQYFWTIKDQC